MSERFFSVSIVKKKTSGNLVERTWYGSAFVAVDGDEMAAVEKLMADRITPSGPCECMAVEVSEMPPPKFVGRLLSKADLDELDRLDELPS